MRRLLTSLLALALLGAPALPAWAAGGETCAGETATACCCGGAATCCCCDRDPADPTEASGCRCTLEEPLAPAESRPDPDRGVLRIALSQGPATVGAPAPARFTDAPRIPRDTPHPQVRAPLLL